VLCCASLVSTVTHQSLWLVTVTSYPDFSGCAVARVGQLRGSPWLITKWISCTFNTVDFQPLFQLCHSMLRGCLPTLRPNFISCMFSSGAADIPRRLTVFYDASCSVCDWEISHYKNLQANHPKFERIDFQDISRCWSVKPLMSGSSNGPLSAATMHCLVSVMYHKSKPSIIFMVFVQCMHMYLQFFMTWQQ
jgi:hypothetical protein